MVETGGIICPSLQIGFKYFIKDFKTFNDYYRISLPGNQGGADFHGEASTDFSSSLDTFSNSL